MAAGVDLAKNRKQMSDGYFPSALFIEHQEQESVGLLNIFTKTPKAKINLRKLANVDQYNNLDIHFRRVLDDLCSTALTKQILSIIINYFVKSLSKKKKLH